MRKSDIKPNVMLLAALANSMRIGFAQEEELKKYQEMLQIGKTRTRQKIYTNPWHSFKYLKNAILEINFNTT